MIINELNAKQKITIISVLVLFIALFVLLFFLQPHNQYGNEIGINNYDRYIPNLPADRRDAINSNLYNIVKLNLKSGNPNVNDATIRENSANNNYNKDTNVYSGSFIVDMKSVKQSYLISYNWSSDENNINIGGYAATVTCLPSDKLIYGNFDCKDDFNNPVNNANRDPILAELPHSTFNYSITADNDSGKIGLNVEIFLYLADTRDGGRDDSIKQYKSDAINWIKSIKLNPDDYLINYSIKG